MTQAASAAIFGGDTRMRVTPGIARARATAVAVLSANFSEHEGKIALSLDKMSDVLCSDEKFASDPSLSFACTGFLVAPDLLVTAGHCMVNVGEERHETETYCQAFSWLFDYNSGLDYANIPSEKLVGCKEVMYAIREEKAPFRDFAIVRLQHAVTDREPLRMASSMTVSAPLSMIGYPFGTPAKISSGARVLFDAPLTQSFVTNLDAFEGNSGSPVFDADGLVVGILVGGTPIESFVHDPVRECQRYNHCAEDGTGCMKADSADDLKAIPEFQAPGSIVQRIGPVIPFVSPSIVVGI